MFRLTHVLRSGTLCLVLVTRLGVYAEVLGDMVPPPICSLSGVEISSITYLGGQPGAPGSVYAMCDNGELSCYQHDIKYPGAKTLVKCPGTDSPSRRLSAEAGEQCKLNGIPIEGVTYLVGAPGNVGSFYATCDSSAKTPKVTCYIDDGLADAPGLDKEVVCANIPKTNVRRLSAYAQGVELWPKGVVCYKFNHPTNDQDYKKVLDFMKQDMDVAFFKEGAWKKATEGNAAAAMEAYASTGIEFIHIDDCQRLYNNRVCGACEHYANIEFNADVGWWANPTAEAGCRSNIGFRYYEAEQSQRVILSLGCTEVRTIIHELGHTLGLQHDHQRPDRSVILLKEKAKQAGLRLKDLAILKKPLEGSYDVSSIMHYDGLAFCHPRPEFAGTTFCDVEPQQGCTEAVEKDHCLTQQDAIAARLPSIGGTTLSTGDILALTALYRNEIAQRPTSSAGSPNSGGAVTGGIDVDELD